MTYQSAVNSTSSTHLTSVQKIKRKSTESRVLILRVKTSPVDAMNGKGPERKEGAGWPVCAASWPSPPLPTVLGWHSLWLQLASCILWQRLILSLFLIPSMVGPIKDSPSHSFNWIVTFLPMGQGVLFWAQWDNAVVVNMALETQRPGLKFQLCHIPAQQMISLL